MAMIEAGQQEGLLDRDIALEIAEARLAALFWARAQSHCEDFCLAAGVPSSLLT